MAASCTVLAVKPRAFLVYAVVVSVLELALLLAVLLLVLPALGLKVPDWAVALIATGMTLMSVILTKLNLRAIGIRPSRSPDVGVRAQVVKALEPRLCSRGKRVVAKAVWARYRWKWDCGDDRSHGRPATGG